MSANHRGRQSANEGDQSANESEMSANQGDMSVRTHDNDFGEPDEPTLLAHYDGFG